MTLRLDPIAAWLGKALAWYPACYSKCPVLADTNRISSSLDPPPEQLFATTVERSQVPMQAPKLIDTMEKVEALFVG